jgi:hypothetical protein
MQIEVSSGEILDKLNILSIKLDKVKDPKKLANVTKEYHYLYELCSIWMVRPDIIQYYVALSEVNHILWETEDKIRVKERLKEFDDEFIQLARDVYTFNDKRAELKRKLNELTGSEFIEEKSYEQKY